MTNARQQADHPLIEVCVEGIDGLVAAQNAGADRIELCAALAEGGITPSIGVITAAIEIATIPFHVIIRPRGGDFVYSALEFQTMRDDIEACRDLDVSGVVVGCLTADGRIDEPRTRALVETAKPMTVTCHRAFDMARDVEEAIEALVRCGIDRVLTSGQQPMALAGLDNLRRTVAAARNRLRVMACGGLDTGNIAAVRRMSGAHELHFAALKTVSSAMVYRNEGLGMGDAAPEREYLLTVTDEEVVRAVIAAARAG